YLVSEEARVLLEDIERLKTRKLLTIMTDGWEDAQRRSLYGTLLAEIAEYPVILGLDDVSGDRGTADNVLKIVTTAITRKQVKPDQVIAVCTDSPTTMVAFRRKLKEKWPWVLTLYCFMHAVNNTIGRITSFPEIKAVITRNAKIVSFFNSSHYWGGQLKASEKAKRSLKTNTETRFYALILQAQSIKENRAALNDVCIRDDAQRKIGGLTPVNAAVVETVLYDRTHWALNDQLIRTCKPLVDLLGNIESRDATLADCMLELIAAHRAISQFQLMDGDSLPFMNHAIFTVNKDFHAMNTTLHWLALFLHPLCRKLAISTVTHSRKLEDACKTAAFLAKEWNWTASAAQQLMTDLKMYHDGRAPFAGGSADARKWWSGLIVTAQDHPLKGLAIRILSIVPHSAEVERFFSNLGGIHTPRRSNIGVDKLETLGTLRNHYIYALKDEAAAKGKSTRRKHGHMHTREEGGINVETANDLLADFSWIGPPISTEALAGEDEHMQGPETISLEELDAEFARLDTLAAGDDEGDKLGSDVGIKDVYDTREIESIRNGFAPLSVEEDAGVNDNVTGPTHKWDPLTLLESVGM
ncbi:hypothetical protein BV25DRAFT_1978033, partial [Artomyces pyxidatus]